MFDNFFKPCNIKDYPPCGLFSTSHIIALIVLLIIIFISAYFCRNLGEKKTYKLIRIIAIIVTILEIIKIQFNLYVGNDGPMSVIPLHYCSLFIYASLLSGFTKGFIRKVGTISLASICIAGLCFLIYPSTSLTYYPLVHFISFHSLIYHALMFFTGIVVIENKLVALKWKNIVHYIIFVIPFIIVTLIVNNILDTNLMFLNEASGFPLPFLIELGNTIPWLFTLLMVTVLIIFPYIASMIMQLIIHKIRK